MDSTVNTVEQKDKFPKVLTFKEKLGYALRDLGNTAMFDMGQLFLLKYMTDVAHLPAAYAGLVFLIAKIWNAFADVGVGTIIDQRSKIGPLGRFRPFILWSAVPLGLLLIANFTILNFTLTGRMAWAGIRGLVFLYPVAMAVMIIIFMLVYKLSDTRVNEIMIDLAQCHAKLNKE